MPGTRQQGGQQKKRLDDLNEWTGLSALILCCKKTVSLFMLTDFNSFYTVTIRYDQRTYMEKSSHPYRVVALLDKNFALNIIFHINIYNKILSI